MYVCMYVCMLVCIYMYVCLFVCINLKVSALFILAHVQCTCKQSVVGHVCMHNAHACTLYNRPHRKPLMVDHAERHNGRMQTLIDYINHRPMARLSSSHAISTLSLEQDWRENIASFCGN